MQDIDVFQNRSTESFYNALLCLVAQSCLTLCNSMDCSPRGSSAMGILQARILEWAAMPSLPGDLPNSGIEPRFPTLQADSLLSKKPWKPKKEYWSG